MLHQSPELKTDKDKFSYALGMNFGVSLRSQGLDLDPTLFAGAFAAAFETGKTAMSEQEMEAVLTVAAQDLHKKQAEKDEKVKLDGEKFLAENKSRDGVVTLPSGLQYKVLTQGKGEKPAFHDSVSCHYRGTLIDGTEFDSSYNHGAPVTFPLRGVIRGWTEALQLMAVGSKWQLFIPSDLAYGEQGPPGIGPNATLIFEVELVAIQ